ncbi:photosystem I reaction center subunit XII [Cyanobium gracile PCC 6307]|jgi:photosystem I subunit 12|uniref:Photosystem I reaction center subunit XII n=3 Tax=Cyanophyceae TaxID=3028117 RepID=K9P3W3_CYAGP|nr:photosystem I reaction center subunit XII [Cyanobium gracile PCC 6307]
MAEEWVGQTPSTVKDMVTPINQAEVLIALIVAAHAGVLAVRLCFSLYKA